MRNPDPIRNAAAQRLLSGQAWDDFCDSLKQTGRLLEQLDDVPTELERAEWYRFLTRLVRNGFERFVENCEPNRPRLKDASWRQSINFQCPDQDHLLCEFDEAVDYRVTGNLRDIPYFVMAVWSAAQPADLGARNWAERGVEGLKEFDPAMLHTTAFLPSEKIQHDADGNFEVILSQHPHEGNWLKLEHDSVGMLVRVVHQNRNSEKVPHMHIERLDGAAPRPIQPDELSRGLAKAAQEVLGYAELARSWWQDNLGLRPNQLRFSQATYLSNGGVADRHHAFGSWHLSPGEALVLEFTPPECEYWIFQLCNLWQENLDNYEDGQGYINNSCAEYGADGLIRIIIADQNPGLVGNWIDP
ncbi:MAG: DUF1214 domain-containing protein, partial [Pseudomonas sp.]